MSSSQFSAHFAVKALLITFGIITGLSSSPNMEAQVVRNEEPASPPAIISYVGDAAKIVFSDAYGYSQDIRTEIQNEVRELVALSDKEQFIVYSITYGDTLKFIKLCGVSGRYANNQPSNVTWRTTRWYPLNGSRIRTDRTVAIPENLMKDLAVHVVKIKELQNAKNDAASQSIQEAGVKSHIIPFPGTPVVMLMMQGPGQVFWVDPTVLDKKELRESFLDTQYYVDAGLIANYAEHDPRISKVLRNMVEEAADFSFEFIDPPLKPKD